MAAIPDRYLDQLRSKGLVISEPFVPDHIAFPDGVAIGKPESVPGNRIANYKCGWGDRDVYLDAPVLFFHHDAGKWIVTSHDYVPGPGPGDFVDEWLTAEEAVADILDFFFGDPSRIASKPA